MPHNPAVSERDYVRFIRTSLRNGRPVCIKYPLARPRGLRFHARSLLSGLYMRPFLRALPPPAAAEKSRLEIAKLRAFKAANIAVPDILAVQDKFSVFADIGKNIRAVLGELRRRNAALHDDLLIGCGRALGQVHNAGLCLGRADLRNMYLAAHNIGFLGFCDYPEEFMPKYMAQMRDIWFMLLLIAAEAEDKSRALAAGFQAWRRYAGLDVLEELRANARFFRLSLRLYRLLPPSMLGAGGRNKLRVLQFLTENLGI